MTVSLRLEATLDAALRQRSAHDEISLSDFMRSIVVDSGPLIALFGGSNHYHKAAVRFLERNLLRPDKRAKPGRKRKSRS